MNDPKGYYAAYGLRPPKPRPKAKPRQITNTEAAFAIRMIAFALFMTVATVRLATGMDYTNNERHIVTYLLVIIALQVAATLKEKP